MAAELSVVRLKIRHRAARLTPPAIVTKDPLVQFLVRQRDLALVELEVDDLGRFAIPARKVLVHLAFELIPGVFLLPTVQIAVPVTARAAPGIG